jgi:hypothetical protein
LEDFLAQLNTVTLSEPYLDRFGELLPVFLALCPEPIDIFFVSERHDAERGIVIDSLWAFSRNYWLEARDFLTKVDIDVAPYRVSYLGMAANNYVPFGPSTKDSVLEVEVETGRRTYSFLSATGANCEYLASIVRERLVRSLTETTTQRKDRAPG